MGKVIGSNPILGTTLRQRAEPHSLPRAARRGFTLIELMIVVSIIGILAAIAVPKFAELIRKSREGTTHGNMGALRSALSIYYADMEGTYPSTLESLTIGAKYITEIPVARTPNYHLDSRVAISVSDPSDLTDAGGWGFCSDPAAECVGQMVVNCTHTDTKGTQWQDY